MTGSVVGPAVNQPWNQVVWPAVEGAYPGWLTEQDMKAIPAVGRGLSLIEGMAMQMPLDAVEGDVVLSRPVLLDQPDPTRDRAWFVGRQVDDYLVHGNACILITARSKSGWPLAVAHLPAAQVTIGTEGGPVQYFYQGRELPASEVVHVQRGMDPLEPRRGVGVLEQHMRHLARVEKQTRYEEKVLDGAAVPSAVVTMGGVEKPSEEELERASDRWMERFGGPQRRPVFLPDGSQVTPLSWSPADSQLVEARQLSLVDVANILNLDAFWLGGSVASGLTYRSPGPMWLNLLRQTAAPILEQFELAWSQAWLPRGQRVKFARDAILSEDKSTAVSWIVRARAAGLVTQSEGRVALGYSSEVPDEIAGPPVTKSTPVIEQNDDKNTTNEDQEENHE